LERFKILENFGVSGNFEFFIKCKGLRREFGKKRGNLGVKNARGGFWNGF
jgi:hypothetical protein